MPTTLTAPPAAAAVREAFLARDQWQARAREDAVRRYGHAVDAETVAACFDAAVRLHAGARVTDYVPVLVERRLRTVLGRRSA